MILSRPSLSRSGVHSTSKCYTLYIYCSGCFLRGTFGGWDFTHFPSWFYHYVFFFLCVIKTELLIKRTVLSNIEALLTSYSVVPADSWTWIFKEHKENTPYKDCVNGGKVLNHTYNSRFETLQNTYFGYHGLKKRASSFLFLKLS